MNTLQHNTQSTNTHPITTTLPPKIPKTWLLIFLIVLLLLSATVVLSFKYYKLKQQLDNQPPPELVASSPLPVISPNPEVNQMENWQTYIDDEYKYQVQYPTPKSDYYKKTLPVKQFLDNDLSQGYRLTLSLAGLAGYNFDDYFLIIVKKARQGYLLNELWKEYSQLNNKSNYQLNKSTIKIDGKNALLVDSIGTKYSENKNLEVYQWVFIPVNDTYYMQIEKGKSQNTNQILSSIKFVN